MNNKNVDIKYVHTTRFCNNPDQVTLKDKIFISLWVQEKQRAETG